MLLANGIELGEDYMTQKETTQRMSREQVKAVFASNSKVESAWCECSYCGNKKSHEWKIIRVGKRIAIGCVLFRPPQITAVRKWMRKRVKA